MSWNNETEEYRGYYIAETDMAILFRPTDWEEKDGNVWLPKSQIEYDKSIEYDREDDIVIEIPNWLAEDKELI